MSDLRQSLQFALYLQKLGWQAGKINGDQLFIKNIPFLGNFVKIMRPQGRISPKTLKELARKYQAFAVQINYSPTKTLRLNLDSPLENILGQMTKEARYEIRKAQANRVIINKSQEIELFARMWAESAFRRGFWLPFKKEIRSVYEAFGDDAFLLLGYLGNLSDLDKRPLAGVLILISGKTASYFHAASAPLGRKMSAPSLIVWEAIKLAKEKGCEVFDFEGIYDERFPIKSWKGFTHFKKSFGGKEIEYPKTFTRYYKPRFLRWFPEPR